MKFGQIHVWSLYDASIVATFVCHPTNILSVVLHIRSYAHRFRHLPSRVSLNVSVILKSKVWSRKIEKRKQRIIEQFFWWTIPNNNCNQDPPSLRITTSALTEYKKVFPLISSDAIKVTTPKSILCTEGPSKLENFWNFFLLLIGPLLLISLFFLGNKLRMAKAMHNSQLNGFQSTQPKGGLVN